MASFLAHRSDRAFERIYQQHVGDVYRYTLAVLRNSSDAEDVTQTTFLNAYRAFAAGERPRQPQNWLIAIAHNVCRQRFRQSQRRVQEVAYDDTIAESFVGDDETPTAEDIRRAISHLAFNQRAALVMRELEGRTYNEIAEILGLSVGAVETLIFRARRALREQLEGSLTCRDAELAVSRQLDGRLPRSERGRLRAHLRACDECTTLARKLRAQRSAIKALGLVPVPASLTTFFGGASAGGTAAAGVGAALAAKAAAGVAASVVLAGSGYELVQTRSGDAAGTSSSASAVDGTAAAAPAHRSVNAATPAPLAFAPRTRAGAAPYGEALGLRKRGIVRRERAAAAKAQAVARREQKTNPKRAAERTPPAERSKPRAERSTPRASTRRAAVAPARAPRRKGQIVGDGKPAAVTRPAARRADPAPERGRDSVDGGPVAGAVAPPALADVAETVTNPLKKPKKTAP